MPSLAELLKSLEQKKLNSNYYPTQNIEAQRPAIDPQLQQSYMESLQPKEQGFMKKYGITPSVITSLAGAGTALTGGDPYLAGSLGQVSQQMAQQEISPDIEREKQQKRLADYVKGIQAQQQKFDVQQMESNKIAKLFPEGIPDSMEITGYSANGNPMIRLKKEPTKVYQVDDSGELSQIGAIEPKAKIYKQRKPKQTLAEKIEEKSALTKATATGRKEVKKILPANKATEIGDITSSIEMLDNLSKEALNIRGLQYNPLDKAKALNPWDTGANQFNQLVAMTKQVIGKGLEGGVLRKEDESKYDKIIPKLGDTKPVLAVKAKQLNLLLENKYKNTTQSLDRAGYDITGFGQESNKIGKYEIVGIE